MEIKEGDKVILRDDLEARRLYGGVLFVEGMKRYKGYVLTVKQTTHNLFFIEDNIVNYTFTTEMVKEVLGKKEKYFCIEYGK
ncbi:MAG: hypothetical protein ACOC2W_03095 [bacterium]